MVSIREIKGPDFSKVPLTTIDMSGSQLVFPLPDDTSEDREPVIDNIDLFDDSQHYNGETGEERYFIPLRSSWNYIDINSSLVVGGGYITILVSRVHHKTGLAQSSVLKPNNLKQWIHVTLKEEHTKTYEVHVSQAESVGENPSSIDKFVFPESPNELDVKIENGALKCHTKSGALPSNRQYDRLHIPVSPSHVVTIYLDFGGFPYDYLGPKEEIHKLQDRFVEEFFSLVRMNYSDEVKLELAKSNETNF